MKPTRLGVRLWAFVCVLVCIPVIGRAAPPAKAGAASLTPDAVLQQVQKAYAKQGDFTAHFAQSYIDKLSGRHRDESGQMWVKADGRVRFAYQKPEPKDFVFDGNQAFFYEPDNAQVTVFEQFADSPIAQAMQFLWGQGQISQLFAASVCPPRAGDKELCPPAAAGELVVQLVPRSPLPTVHHVALVVDAASWRVVRSVVYDPLENQTIYRFDKLSAGEPIAAKTFAFEIPSGVSVLRAPPMDKAAPVKHPRP
jgi:outer membrane lipoprotein-sorting protein